MTASPAERELTRDQRWTHHVTFLDSTDTPSPVCVPSRVLIDGVDITAALPSGDISDSWEVFNSCGSPVLELQLRPGHVETTPNVYGPGTWRIVLTPPGGEPIELCTPRHGADPDEMPVEFLAEDGATPEPVDRVRLFAASLEFRGAWQDRS